MRQLWAPWRMTYLEESDSEPGCLFCRIAESGDDERHHVVYRGSRCYVMLNLYPYNSGHLMVIPFQHTGELTRIDPDTGADLLAVGQLSVRALQEAMQPQGFNLGINQGEVAGAGIADHIHLHVVPRWGGDTNFMPVLADVKVMPELLEATAAKLRPIFASLSRAE
jgi:ATP adenylyltransferase